jgi:hypothetical protein
MGKSNKSLELTPEVAAGSGATIRVNGGGCAWSAGQLNSMLCPFGFRNMSVIMLLLIDKGGI